MQDKQYLYDLNVSFDMVAENKSQNKLKFQAVDQIKALGFLKMLKEYSRWSDEIKLPISRNYSSIQMGLKDFDVVVTVDVYFSEIETFSAVEMITATNESLVSFLKDSVEIVGFLG